MEVIRQAEERGKGKRRVSFELIDQEIPCFAPRKRRTMDKDSLLRQSGLVSPLVTPLHLRIRPEAEERSHVLYRESLASLKIRSGINDCHVPL